MPLQYKIPGYVGNALLLLLGLVVLFQGNVVLGILFGGLGLLNLYLVYKLDSFSDPDAAPAHELEVAKMQEELLVAKKRIGELEAQALPPTAPR